MTLHSQHNHDPQLQYIALSYTSKHTMFGNSYKVATGAD